MYLPPEVIENILSRCLEAHKLPRFPFSDFNGCKTPRYVLWRDLIDTDQHASLASQRPPLDHRIVLDESIFGLRLISITWYQSVTALLDKYRIPWIIDLNSKTSLPRALACLSDEALECTRLVPTREIVKRLIINPGRSSLHGGSIRPSQKDLKDGYLLSRFFNKLDRVESFSLNFPPCGAKGHGIGAVEEIIKAIRCGIETKNAFKHMTDLQVKIPSTFHGNSVLSAMGETDRARLLHLLIEIMDDTGMSGNQEYLQWTHGEFEDWDGTTDEENTYLDEEELEEFEAQDARSSLQRAYPNRKHQQGIWDFIASCPHLETLGVQGTHFLDLDKLQWQPRPGFQGLRVLYLSRIHANIPSILQLICSEDKDSPSHLERIVIDDVKIRENGGDWGEDFLQYLIDCPNLDLVACTMLTYFCEHERAREGRLDDYDLIRSAHYEDKDFMEQLVRRMIEKTGRDLYSWPYALLHMADSLHWINDGKLQFPEEYDGSLHVIKNRYASDDHSYKLSKF